MIYETICQIIDSQTPISLAIKTNKNCRRYVEQTHLENVIEIGEEKAQIAKTRVQINPIIRFVFPAIFFAYDIVTQLGALLLAKEFLDEGNQTQAIATYAAYGAARYLIYCSLNKDSKEMEEKISGLERKVKFGDTRRSL